MNFNEKMRYLREKKGLTQEEVAKGIGISVSSIKNYEKNRLADTYTLKLIRQYYNVPYEFLLDDTCINENEDNILIGKALNLSDTSINKLKEINSIAQNNITDNFIKNTSTTFWNKLDEYLTLLKEKKEWISLKEKINSLSFLSDYTTKDDIENYIIWDDEYSGSANMEEFYKSNSTEYNSAKKNKILEILKDLQNAPLLMPYSEPFCLLSDIIGCIQNNSLIPICTMNDLSCFIDFEIQAISEKSGKIRSDIIKNFSNYLNIYK